MFREATLDRFHGFIPGWEIPRFHQGLIADGWGLNTQYFAEVLHKLREEMQYTTLVSSCVDLPKKADKRDVDAITRLCTAFIKLIFPHWTEKSDVDEDEFMRYCLEPAKSMRQIVRTQLGFVKPKEFKDTVVANILFREGKELDLSRQRCDNENI